MKNTLYWIVFSVFIGFSACKQKEKPAEITVEKFNRDSILANDAVLKKTDSISKIIQKSEEERLKMVTSIRFEKEMYDFGECVEGDKVKKVLTFKNNGKLPLVINQAYGSCGCTVPKFDKEPVQPGETGELEIVFDSSHKVGANTKSVMIEANTNPPVTTISFSIKVKENKKKNGWFN
jgi:hypothetical protein